MVLAANCPKLYGFQNNLDFEDLFWEQLSLSRLGLLKIFFASLKQIFHSDFSQVAFPLVVA